MTVRTLHKHLNSVQSRAVNFLFIPIIFFMMTGCSTHKQRFEGCMGYEQKYYYSKDAKSGLLVHGRVRICDTRKIVPFAKVKFMSDSGARYEATADKRGYYKINLPGPYFVGKIEAHNYSRGRSGSIIIEDVFFGHGNACELNIYLIYNFYHDVPLLKNDIIWIKENSKKREQEAK